ncbi:hypothetical protein THMIRHAS_12560 [Thiosulfatimonas sediminis]|uniref:Uncharacterized protein n=1 Tax=Thiosulfatimonas sediminis TaxID=2675054 RepID=A0A6F8PUS2_9GAMM|nr:hypothetical protein [Thiosulfatimonas sediminis]BBP45883.1 hypothetical protein THMIRHAS_12560 [Thiosulfatimonas sediminis]
MSMLSILIKDAAGTQIPVISYKGLDEIIMDLYLQKRWDIIEVTDNAGSFKFKVKDGVVQKTP